jgi:hypothetical protein
MNSVLATRTSSVRARSTPIAIAASLFFAPPACTRNEPARPSPAQADASSSAARATLDGADPVAPTGEGDAALAGDVGPEGGVVETDGARIVVPPGGFKLHHVLKIARASEADLASWPRGTMLGFSFEPVDKRFRVPATIELPHVDPEGEVMCQNGSGERRHERFGSSYASGPFRFHVVELPSRCAVYSKAHMIAREHAKETEAAIVAKHNQSFKWELKGKTCDPHELTRPNAGKDLREPPGLGGCPAGMARIPNKKACVDRWEAHLVELLDDGTEHTWSPYFNPGGLRVRAKSAPGAIPQGYISQLQAGAACRASSKRLCKDDEWIAACRGPKSTQFPYGKEEKRGTCNDQRDTHPAMQYLESRDLSVFSKLEHPCINQIQGSLLDTGEKKACVTPDSAFDMVGNLHEWTADPEGTFRGGYYVDTWLNGHGCDYVTTRHEARYWDYSTGFRCCADAS